MRGYKCCDKCFDRRLPEFTIALMKGVDDCEICGTPRSATHWQDADLPAPIERVLKIDVEDGDVLAICLKGSYLSAEKREQIIKGFQDAFLPKNVKVIMVNADVMDLKVVRVKELVTA